MDVKVCRVCKKMFQYITGPEICPKCRKLEEEHFQKVKEYLRENPGAEITKVSEETGVSVKLIEKFLRDERLEVVAGSPMSLTCERCGKKITTGRYCAQCRTEISNELNLAKKSLIKENAKEDDNGPKMRYFHREH